MPYGSSWSMLLFYLSGRKFDKNGDIVKEWWSKSSLMEFNKKSECIERQYSKYKVQGLYPVRGVLILMPFNLEHLFNFLVVRYCHDLEYRLKARYNFKIVSWGTSFTITRGWRWDRKTQYAITNRLRVRGKLGNLSQYAVFAKVSLFSPTFCINVSYITYILHLLTVVHSMTFLREKRLLTAWTGA